ncbi:MAG: helix-turn-helix transcriptional regulator [Prolixibacteraceae bacterium]
MAKKEAITRYHLIINKVRKHSASFKEIQKSIEQHFDTEELNLKFSKRTFHRDIAEIASLYNIEIKHNPHKKGYEIVHEDDSNSTHHLLEAFDVFNALNMQERLSDYIHFENRNPKGTENIHGILHAIKNKLQIGFIYQSFWHNSPKERMIQPLALKEFKNRWYIVSLDTKDNLIKTFALDRLSELEITRKKFETPTDFDVHKHYQHCFGIMSPNAVEPSRVVLSFQPHKGKYIKSLPLHKSQQELINNKQEFRIQLTVYLTHDFIMEILSHGQEVKVVEPDHLLEAIRINLIGSLDNYINS